jgi:hypothetical protein
MNIRLTTLALSLLTLASAAHAQTLCIYDPEGSKGGAYNEALSYQKQAADWNVKLEVKPYTDETVAVEDFKAGQCDMVVVTGLRAREFNKFASTIDSLGGVESYAEMQDVLTLAAAPALQKYMVNGQYEVAGIFPLGAGYAFVNDRSINTLGKAAGKKIAVMDWDKVQSRMVQQIGAQPVLSDITSYGPKFNNGVVDIVVAPLILYKPFELYKGIGSKGGVVRFPILQLTAQAIMRRKSFPEGFGQKSRDYVIHELERPFKKIQSLEGEIDSKAWIDVPDADRAEFTNTLRTARVKLTKEGYYDKHMLSLLKHERCKVNAAAAECALKDE